MTPTAANMNLLFSGFSAAYNKAFDGAPSRFREVAMVAPSSAREETYAWLGALAPMREWVGDRVVHRLRLHGYTVVNKKWEQTISVPRTDVEDDRIGVYAPMFEVMGRQAAMQPDELVFGLLGRGFAERCHDGQYFFDADHPVGMGGAPASVSNVQAGGGPAWFLLDCGQPVKPLIFQERIRPQFTALTDPADEPVFWRDEYVYGARARNNAGFGLWQCAFASKAPLDAAGYAAARAAMQEFRSDAGKPLGIMPTHLVVPPALESAALRLLNAAQVAGTTNEWAGTAKIVVTPYLAA